MLAEIAILMATLLCSLVAGLLLGFVVVVMPGIGKLGDREFLRAFQEMDGVIQRGQPVFGLVWIGSVLTLIAGFAVGLGRLPGFDLALLGSATGFYLLGVQLPTFRINIPLNNEVQALDLSEADDATCRSARGRFEARWNRWNTIRTSVGIVTATMLGVLLLRI